MSFGEDRTDESQDRVVAREHVSDVRTPFALSVDLRECGRQPDLAPLVPRDGVVGGNPVLPVGEDDGGNGSERLRRVAASRC